MAINPVGVLVAFPLPGSALLLDDRPFVFAVSVSETWALALASPIDTSLCKGEEWTGELDFLLAASLPPREEFRGETLPVCSNVLSVNQSRK